jgi:hypothetical protein
MSAPAPWRFPVAPLLAGIVAVGLATSARAVEPRAERWTPITEETEPSWLVNYANLPVRRARDLLLTAEASLLWDPEIALDALPADEPVALRARRRLAFDPAYEVVRDDEGRPVLVYRPRRRESPVRVHDAPARRVLGLPTAGRRGAWSTLAPYDPMVFEVEEGLVITCYVETRMRDPFDVRGNPILAALPAVMTIPYDAILEAPRDRYRLMLILGGKSRTEPRLLFLPVRPDGQLDTDREGVVIRMHAQPSSVERWEPRLDELLRASAVRLHLGDEASLEAHLAALPPVDRSSYQDPGGPDDPLMLTPRTDRDPLGAGIEIRSGALGDITLFDLRGVAPSHVVPRWGGVRVQGWVGHAWAGAVIRDDVIQGAAGVRLGRMRDTEAVELGIEVGRHLGLGPSASFSTGSPLSVNAVARWTELTDGRALGRPVEAANAFRVGTLGLEYHGAVGVRLPTGDGLIVTPAFEWGMRYALRERRALLMLGGAIEATWNRNVWVGRR